ncbi:anthranilate phosphoribosyltransferase family protein [Cyanobacterium stanieri LEGE 03274]|uniref:Anthranilate phosphoribosyltransferase family protein n=1 Tax=Cyanobacterium stanieri LEGE 03274 TaxID=1828756 RepID=A0ABR9V335_9CHRO|nr:anthranilate phosphoribosyltransferase family protein [Cyanobacterium stanieri]MBE9221541.1 anthranilate phosphoribosyltransferase family protein [Cyanobacterium stanieri LEGE 03274]
MSAEFRELLKKVGSGAHTHKNLTREEAHQAATMMLTGEATPAQIGAFLIAHRIKRPTGIELAGMLDAYSDLGAKLNTIPHISYPLTILGIPYDGRSRTAPISPITALILACHNIPVLMHGGKTMPTKYGLPLIEIWQNLGVNLTQLSIEKAQNLLEETNFSFLYLPEHFPLANKLVQYREEIGKRPPLATLELIWQPYTGNSHLIAGFVHPPTEKMIREALKIRGIEQFTLIKGLEGSPDLKLGQTTIICVNNTQREEGYEYLKIHPEEFNLSREDVDLKDYESYYQEVNKLLQGQQSILSDSVILNGGFYLWRCGFSSSLKDGIDTVINLLDTDKLFTKLEEIKAVLNS